jgi:ribosomal-protein-alanine N-acetyltransferase
MSWQLRRANADDLDAVMHLETTTFSTDAWSSANMLADLTNPNCYYLVAFDSDGQGASAQPLAIEGYAGLLAPRRSTEGDIQTIAVAASARRRGLGRLLMLALITEARERGVRELFLEVRDDNPNAEALYASLGFARIGVRPGYYQPDNVDAIVMRLEVRAARTEWAAERGASDEPQ